MQFNWLAIVLSTLAPLVLGFIWYNPRIGFGKAWMTASGMTEEKARGANMPRLLLLTALFALMASFALIPIVVHQVSVGGILSQQPDGMNPDSHAHHMLTDFMEHYGTSFRTFKHGAFHGTLTDIFLAIPLIGTNALYERRGFRYIAINAGYWIVSFALMGGILCALV